jgi:DNA ligase-1
VKRFARLFSEIDVTTRTTEKVDAMARYFRDAAPADAAWAVYFLAGGRPKRLVPVRRLSEWAMAEADVPDWLFGECHDTVGDLAETITLLLPESNARGERPLHEWIEQRLLPLATRGEDAQRETVLAAWRELGGTERFVWNKVITGGFRVGVSQQLVVKALAKVSGVDEGTIAHRLTGSWHPSAESFAHLVAADTSDADRSKPYPFYLAYPLESELENLGSPAEWQVEWKWDGIRAQLVKRDGRVWIWSRGDELVTERFPEVTAAAEFLPDGVVLDGEIMPWRNGRALPFAQLQRRIGRLKLGPKILADVPIVLIAYDLLELDGRDVRTEPLAWRREHLARLVASARAESRLLLSPTLTFSAWDELRAAHVRAREELAEGLMLKRLDAPYGVGRRKGNWWKWKVQPHSVDAVMIYAQAGHGRRASLHTDYTFAVWDAGTLVPFAKAYTGLTDAEIQKLDSWVRRNTIEKFGPVRQVAPEQVFELAFEGIQLSPRHRSGVAVRFPRILRWRTDKPASEADTLDTLRALLATPHD